MVYLSVFEQSLRVIDSTPSKEGRFSIRMPEILPDVVFVGFESNPDLQLPVMVEGENVRIEGSYAHNRKIRVRGSRANDDLERYRESVNRYDIMLKAVEVSINEYRDSTEVVDSLSYGALLEKRDHIKKLVDNSQREFIENNPSSIVSAMFALNILSEPTNKQSVEQMIQKLDTEGMPDNAFLRRIYRRREDFK